VCVYREQLNSLKYRADHQVREFGDDKPKGERLPIVNLGLLFSRFKDIPPPDEERLDLRDNPGGDKDEAEHSKDLVLEVDRPLPKHPIREPVEQRGKDVQGRLVGDVFGIPEERDTVPLVDDLALFPQARCKLLGLFVVSDRSAQSILFDRLEFFLNRSVFRGVEPDLGPIVFPRQFSRDDVDHVFSGVTSGRTRRAGTFEVVFDGGGLVTDRTVVDRLASSSEKEQVIEFVEERGTRLMDSNEDYCKPKGESVPDVGA
jgi:hypothetical protein